MGYCRSGHNVFKVVIRVTFEILKYQDFYGTHVKYELFDFLSLLVINILYFFNYQTSYGLRK